MESDTISPTTIVFCIIVSAYFSATETAFSSLNRIRVKNMAEEGNKRAAFVLKLSGDYDGMLSTILVGSSIVNIACASLSTLIFMRFLGDGAGASVSTVVTTIVVLIFGEVSPKNIARESPERLAVLSTPLLNVFIKILAPANFLLRQWKKLLSAVFRSSDERGITEEKLLTIVDEAGQGGGINKQEGTLICGATEFTELETGDIFTPRIDIIGIPMDADKEEITELFARIDFFRLPVYKDNVDCVIGIFYQKDSHNYVIRADRDIREMVKPAMFIVQTKKIGQLLEELQRGKMHITVILDGFGGTMGVVTLEDILEELVSDIWDEYDTVVQEIEKISDQECLVPGNTSIGRLFELLQKDQGFNFLTANGWVTGLARRVPKEGGSFECQNLNVAVLKVVEERVEQIRVMVKDNQPPLPEE